MVHQGKILKRQIEKQNLTQTDAAELLSLSRSGLTLLFNKVTLADKHIDKAVAGLGLNREIFFPQQVEKSQQKATSPDCWQQLVAAQARIIELQEQIISMSQPNYNAPVRAKQTA